MLLVGNPALPLKGFDVAIAVLAMVNRVLPLSVTWICQTQPTPTSVPGLASCGLRINLHISPSQVRVLPRLSPRRQKCRMSTDETLRNASLCFCCRREHAPVVCAAHHLIRRCGKASASTSRWHDERMLLEMMKSMHH